MADAGRSKSKSRKRLRACTTQKKQNANTSDKVCIEERRRSSRILERGAEPSSNNNNEEMEPGYSAILERPRAAMNSPLSSQSLKAQKKTKKKKRNTVIIKNAVSESDSEKEVIEIADEGECSNPASSHLGNGGSMNKTRVNKGVPLLGGTSCKGWTKDQEIALHNAYYTIKPVPNFWKEIAKLVPGKSSKECFNRFYSAYPTPPVTQPRSRMNRKNCESPIRSFANDLNTLLKSAGSSGGRSGSSRQKVLHARKTVRQILRQHKKADKGYEADLFSAIENVDPSVQSFLLPTATPVTPDGDHQAGGHSTSDQTLSCCRPKSLSRFSADSHRQLQKKLLSPEVLKQIKNPALHDKYIDLLHSREVARKKAWAQNTKFQSNNVQTLPQTDAVCAAKAAVVAEAQQVLRQSQTNEKKNCFGIQYHTCGENGEEECDEDNEDADEEEMEDLDLS